MDALSEIKELSDRLLWRDIATAPKDGTKFLAFMEQNPDISPQIIFWSDIAKTWLIAWDDMNIEKEWNDKPVYWMPLPSPPPEIED